MAPRANWKGLRLSLVTVALYPATSESEKISFNQVNRATGHRIRYLKVDADTDEEVPNEDIEGLRPGQGQLHRGVGDPQEYFDEIRDVKVTKDMIDLARHIVNQKSGHFEPEKFEDQYETALIELIPEARR